MTGFATLSGWRGKGLAAPLFKRINEEARRAGITTAITITGASSYGMNKAFKNCGYTYSGFLTNYTRIDCRPQSMTVWHKNLDI